MSDYRNDDENKELTSQTVTDDHKTEDKREDEYEKYCCRKADRYAGQYTYLCRLYAEDL